MNGQEIKNEFDKNVSDFITGVVIHQGTVVGVLKKACAINKFTTSAADADYRLVLKVLTGKTSSKELSDAQWSALYKFVLPIKPEGGHWQSGHGDSELSRMCDFLVRMTVQQPGQMEMPLDA